MLLTIIRIIYAFICAGAIATFLRPESEIPPVAVDHPFLSALVLFALTQSVTLIDILIRKKRIEVLSAIYFGLLVGVLLSYLLMLGVELVIGNRPESEPIRNIAALFSLLVLPYLCISMLLQTKDDFRFIVPYVEFSRDLKGGKPLILDASALIDGRIADLIDTHILDTEIIVPQFVVHEVQEIADSREKMRRTRGRRGLEVLSKLQNHPHTEVRLDRDDRKDFQEMSRDQRLVELAKRFNGRLLTNDFNLNRAASVQEIPVINLNDVANALKPRYIPGERLSLKVIKEGESPGQGVGYLDDGTMVVCEQAGHLIGRSIDVIVTSVLQSSAGRMIFGRQVHSTSQSERPSRT